MLHEHEAREVCVLGSWDGWRSPGLVARPVEEGVWRARMPRPGAGRYRYKFLLDGARGIADHANPARAHDGYGGLDSLLVLDEHLRWLLGDAGARKGGTSRRVVGWLT